MKFEAVLFDMDGVLIDSEELMAKSGILGLKDYGIDAKPEDFVEFVGCGENRYIGGVAEKHGVPFDPEMKERAYYYYGLYVEDEAQVPPEVKVILPMLKQKGYKIAVCTSGDWNKVVHNLRAIGVDRDVFDGFVTGDKITHLKPDPEIYLTGASLVGTDPANCLVVEDAPSGIRAAHAAGMKVVGITSTFDKEYLIANGNPDYIISSLNELPDILDSAK